MLKLNNFEYSMVNIKGHFDHYLVQWIVSLGIIWVLDLYMLACHQAYNKLRYLI